jgi:hypothetical protein
MRPRASLRHAQGRFAKRLIVQDLVGLGLLLGVVGLARDV